MSRPHKVRSPIRDLREIIEKKQHEFARSLGISPGALKRIENNDLKLSRRVGYKIVFETGVDSRCLNGKLHTLRNYRGEQYTKEFYKAWKDRDYGDPKTAAKLAAQWLTWVIEILLRASLSGYGRKMRLVYAEITETLERCSVDFDLKRPIN